MRRPSLAAVAFLLLLPRVSLLAQCAMCSGSVPKEPTAGGGNWAAGFNWGVLSMLGVLGVLVAGLVGLVVYVVRTEASSEPSRLPASEGL